MKTAALLALLLSGCATPVYRVVVPGTSEGRACWRECMQVFNSCRSGGSTTVIAMGTVPWVLTDADDRDCGAQRDECRLTCPGARVVRGADRPFIYPVASRAD